MREITRTGRVTRARMGGPKFAVVARPGLGKGLLIKSLSVGAHAAWPSNVFDSQQDDSLALAARLGGTPNRLAGDSGPHAFAEAVLEVIGAATWPDGSPLVDVAHDVLRAKLAPQILSAAYSLAAISAATHGGAR